MSLREAVPWWAKIGTKLIVSRVPVGYQFWYRMHIFVHGAMQRPDYALGVVRKHLANTGWNDLRGRTILELGPGDSVATAVIAKALGADHTILVDAGSFATHEVAQYQHLADHLLAEGLAPPDLTGCKSLDDVLVRCDGEYHTHGLTSLRTLPADVADLVFSHAVLEHIRRPELGEMLRETFRLAKHGGYASHQIDLRDNLGGALNHLRFSETLWEAEWMARSGFYSNRFRFRQMLDLLTNAGWDCEVTSSTRWPALPTPRRALAAPFRALDDDELLVASFAVRGCKQ